MTPIVDSIGTIQSAYFLSHVTDSGSISIDPAGEPNTEASQIESGLVSIVLPPALFNQTSLNGDEISILFGMYDSSILFPLPEDSMLFTNPNVTYETFAVASTLAAATIVGFANLTFNDVEITIVLQLHSEVAIIQYIVFVKYMYVYNAIVNTYTNVCTTIEI